MMEVSYERIDVGGVRRRVAQAGPHGGPLVVWLNGFPESSFGWRHRIPALAAAGFRVWAPDGCGYAGSDAPASIDAYAMPRLVDDVAASSTPPAAIWRTSWATTGAACSPGRPWGERDAFLETELATVSAELCVDARVERLAEATHWLHHEEPARVNAAVIGFLAAA